MRKQGIYAKAQAFKSSCDVIQGFDPSASARIRSLLPSIANNGEDILPFIIDLAILLKGSAFIKDMMKEALSDFLKSGLPDLRNSMKGLFLTALPSTQTIGNTQCLIDGMELPMDYVDSMKRLKGNAKRLDTFEKSLKDSIIGGVPMELDGFLQLVYDRPSNSIIAKAIPNVHSMKVSDMLDSIADNFDIDFDGLIDRLVDILFGIFPNRNGSSEARNALMKYIDAEDPSTASFTRFDFNSALGVNRASMSYISSLDCDGQPLPITDSDIDEMYNSEDFVETVYSKLQGSGDVPSDAQSSKLGKNLFSALLLALAEALILSPSSILRNLIYLNLDGDCRLNPRFITPLGYITENMRNLSCLIKRLRDSLFNYLVDILEREVRDLALCIAQRYAKERAESYIRAISTL